MTLGPRSYRRGAPPAGSPRGSAILRLHAEGGLGQVSVALDEELHREVALKEIQDRYADDPESRARFLLEAEITGGLEHPGIVPVYGLGTTPTAGRSTPCGSSGATASRRPSSGSIASEVPARDPGERAWRCASCSRRFVDVCNAIAYAHSRGVLHRDLKPGNIMLGKYGETLVVDWGLAKVDRPAGGGPRYGRSDASALFGQRRRPRRCPVRRSARRQYMSPEQAAGRLDLLGPASDVYSLGATLYCLLTGRAPVRGRASNVRPAEGAAGRVPAAATGQAASRPGLGGDLPEGDGPPARGPVRVASGPGRGHRALAGR